MKIIITNRSIIIDGTKDSTLNGSNDGKEEGALVESSNSNLKKITHLMMS